jgi:hypothetical protein
MGDFRGELVEELTALHLQSAIFFSFTLARTPKLEVKKRVK